MPVDRFFRPFFELADASPALRAFVLEELSAPHRHWHGLLHHALMLRGMGVTSYDPHEARRLVLATLFHDIVYDPKRADNEETSALIARAWVQPRDADAVAALILATKAHDFDADPTTRALLMADLGVLWTPSERLYRCYARGIRAEYAHVPDAPYRAGRTAVLGELRERVSPFLDTSRREALERNLRWELALLEGDDPLF